MARLSPSLSTRLRRVALVLSLLILTPLLLVAGTVGALWWGGHISYGGTGAVVARDLSKPAARLWASQRAARRAGVIGARHASGMVTAACALVPTSTSEVRAEIEALLAAHAPGVDPHVEGRITVVTVPPVLSPLFPARGSMTVVGDGGLMLWSGAGHPDGGTVYHELVHYGQFRRSEGEQRRLLDSLIVDDHARPASEFVAYGALGSVRIPLTYALPDSVVDSFDDAMTLTVSRVVRATRGTPVQHIAAALDSVVARPEFSTMRSRLDQMAWLHQGVPLVAPSATWGWHQELRRLVYFEAMAYRLSLGCEHGPVIAHRVTSRVPRAAPVVVTPALGAL